MSVARVVLAGGLALAAAAPAATPEPAAPRRDPPAARAAVRFALAPESVVVAPGETFTLELGVPAAGPAFNGYDAVVAFDTTALAVASAASDRALEGDDMRGACGNTFHRLSAAGDSVMVSHVLLCARTSIEGPARLHRFQFRATGAAGTATVRVRRAQCFDAGRSVATAPQGETTVVIANPNRGAPETPARSNGRTPKGGRP
uniref:Cohesin domain-containing protein n=1 Tax=Eiseniibacteriota bacterium TaxID=2212470 RepID=A0A832I545_UNCEI